MTQEEKKLLYKDLSARQPYRPFICFAGKITMPLLDVIANTKNNELMSINGLGLDYVKVYLRPMSSMTEEEEREVRILWNEDFVGDNNWYHCYPKTTDFYLSHHLDFRNLIKKGLALEAPKEMYKIE